MIKLWHCIRLSVCVILKLWSFRYSWTWFVITLSDSDVCDECCELNVTMNGDSWTYYDLGCMYELWFEILRDFTDYRDYMGLSVMVRLSKLSLLGLISYNLGGSVTATSPMHPWKRWHMPSTYPLRFDSHAQSDRRFEDGRLNCEPTLYQGVNVNVPRSV